MEETQDIAPAPAPEQAPPAAEPNVTSNAEQVLDAVEKQPAIPISLQKRIDKATARANESERMLAQTRQEVELLQQRLASYANPAPSAQIPETSGAFQKPNKADFASDEEFINACIDYREKVKAAEQQKQLAAHNAELQKQRLEMAKQQLDQNYAEKVWEFSQRNPDFNERLTKLKVLDEIDCYAIKRSSMAPAITYYLTHYPDDEAELHAQADPFLKGKFIGMLEERLTNKSAPKMEPLSNVSGGEAANMSKGDSSDAHGMVDLSELRRQFDKRRRT